MATKELKDIMTDLQKSSDPQAGTLLQKVGNEIKELDGNTIASASNLSALSDRVDDSVEELQESIDNHSQLLSDIDQSKASKEYVNNAIENYTFTASYHTGSSTQDTTWEQFSAAISRGRYKKFECQVLGDAEAYLLKNMYAEVTADGVEYTFSGSIRDKNYSVKFSQLHPAGGVLEVTESAGGLSSVAHDSTLAGDGTTANPLSVVGGGSSSPSTLFKTVADMQAASLNVGDVVETTGFYSVNDGGGAKYQIQSTGTANGMDLIAVAGGKIAKVLLLDSAYPDQLGYKRAISSYDVVPYIKRLFAIGIVHIKLHCDRYYLHQRLDLIAGSSIEGVAKRSDDFSGLSRLIFMNNESPVAITANKYDCRLYNFDLYCSSAHTGDTIGVLTSGSIESGATQQGCIIERVKFNGFKIGCSFEGDVNWNLSVSGCIFENEDCGVVLNSNKLNVQFDTCYWNHCNEADVIVRKYTSAMAFRSCNFGIYKKAVDIQYNRYDWRNFGEIEFSSCNFEVDVNNLQEVTGCFVNVEDYCQVSLIFNSCTFNIDKAGSSTSGFAFGNKSRVVFEACHCQEEQYVNYQGELFNSLRPPELSVGSLHVGYGCYGFSKPSYDVLHSSCVKFDEDFLVANLKVNPNNLYDKVHTYFTYAGIRKINNTWEFFSEPGVYSGAIVIDIPLYYRDKDLTVSMSPASHNRWVIAATNTHPDIDRTTAPTILSEAYNSSDGRDFASINMGGKRYLTIYYYNLPSDASDEKFYIRDDMMLSLGSYHYPYVPHYLNYSDIKIAAGFVNTPSKVEVLSASNGGGVADCNQVIPEQSGTSILAQVNSFDNTLNLPAGFSGFGLLQSSLLINGTRLLQTLFSQSSIYCRRRILVSGSWTWQGWYKSEMTAV